VSSRAPLFRELAEKCARKASAADTEESRRAWLIVARDWNAMAAREETKLSQLKIDSLREIARSQ
jgi:hypothetical protein